MDRREFNTLAVAALGGLMTGASLARAADEKPKPKDPKKPLLLQDPHICRGLNATCKGEVQGKKNDCTGQALLASAPEHVCKGHNDWAGLGGCGEKPGENNCKGMGNCAVPLKDKTWDVARKNFEAAMKKAGKKFGKAPKKDEK